MTALPKDKPNPAMFSYYASLNREHLKTILSEIWEEQVTPEILIGAGKHVGIAPTGLNVDWMNQEKLKTTEVILHPTKTPEKKTPTPNIPSPVNVGKGSAKYYKQIHEKTLEINQTLKRYPRYSPTTKLN